MKPLAWYERSEDDRRVSVAHTFLWLSCAGGLLGLVVGVVAIVLGHVEVWSTLAAHPVRALAGLGILALYVTAAYWTGQRRAAGGVLALALFGYTIVAQAVAGRIFTWHTAWALVGILLIVRAAHALRLPFISTAS
jgi:hypothetical protein